MQLSNLLGLRVDDADGHRVGSVIDVRLRLTEGHTPEISGLVISPRTRSSYLGYERTAVTAPAVIARIARWRHRGTFFAEWSDVARIGAEGVTLRAGHRRHSPALGRE
ncbi:hypothetical protein FR943_09010 [Mycobacterium sp. TNTM28]|uniref:PRC-barrel domain-containing protein n=1 Tax=[Mycobacterium] fortunisiensis TaxID=2600579 RepID=A0ABS6KK62_9MYCO|nr:hypothetical protein [[Mycobacterium] fortunisiensis]MBU9763980.1 hypothetical protein [[Mycobacterium] fortunisiensis]